MKRSQILSINPLPQTAKSDRFARSKAVVLPTPDKFTPSAVPAICL
jgi:hypothetical protein